ncbi:SufBD protein [uncultured Dubosiella sp.]|uniref:SufBD protein n=1 Tax=uncultured Dubosiella sp. TaxID=1937011 RepID=UPI0025CD4329|nr:SufBD protein [uncultured Dubosiella sp.]
MMNTSETFSLLFNKNQNTAYKALKILQKESEHTDHVYPFLDTMIDMLDSSQSYIRTRALILIACNAKWDRENKIDKIIDQYLGHITDEKPITARQCIKQMPMLARYKPELKETILFVLHSADVDRYDESMQTLIIKDIQKAVKEIQK